MTARSASAHADGDRAILGVVEHVADQRPEVLEVLTLEGAQVKQMTAFMVPELFRSFGLPDQLPASWRRRRASVPEPAPPKADGGSGSAT
jgi:hypothetical protein